MVSFNISDILEQVKCLLSCFALCFDPSPNKRMTDVDVTPPSSNACSCLPANLNGYPTFVTKSKQKVQNVSLLTIPKIKVKVCELKRETELKVTSKLVNLWIFKSIKLVAQGGTGVVSMDFF